MSSCPLQCSVVDEIPLEIRNANTKLDNLIDALELLKEALTNNGHSQLATADSVDLVSDQLKEKGNEKESLLSENKVLVVENVSPGSIPSIDQNAIHEISAIKEEPMDEEDLVSGSVFSTDGSEFGQNSTSGIDIIKEEIMDDDAPNTSSKLELGTVEPKLESEPKFSYIKQKKRNHPGLTLDFAENAGSELVDDQTKEEMMPTSQNDSVVHVKYVTRNKKIRINPRPISPNSKIERARYVRRNPKRYDRIRTNLRSVRWLKCKSWKHPIMMLESIRQPNHFYLLRYEHPVNWYNCQRCFVFRKHFPKNKKVFGDIKRVKLVDGMALAKDTDQYHHPDCAPIPIELIESEEQRVKDEGGTLNLNDFYKE